MTIETRLANMKAYREEALKYPQKNKLYIEDLNLSINMFEKQLKTSKPVLQSGWLIDDPI